MKELTFKTMLPNSKKPAHRQASQRSNRQDRKKRSTLSTAGLWLLIGILIGIITATTSYLILTGKWSILPPSLTIESKANNPLAEPKNELAKVKLKKSEKKNNLVEKTQNQTFEFYQLLPGMEVPIPDSSSEAATKVTPNIPEVSLAENSHTEITANPKQDANPVVAHSESTKPPSVPAPVHAPLAKISKPKIATVQKSNKIMIPKKNPKTTHQSTPISQKKLTAAQYLIQAGAFREQPKAENLKNRLTAKGFSSRIQKIEAEDGIWFRVIVGPFATESTALNQKILLTKHKIQGILLLQRR